MFIFRLSLLMLVILGGALLPTPCRLRPHTGGQLTVCKSNLKNIGTALEMYASDHAGKFPGNLHSLTPNYLKRIGECPSARTVTYRLTIGPAAPYNTERFEDFYLVECMGSAHVIVDVPPDFPKYNSIEGLVER